VNEQKSAWCLRCERCYEVHLGREPERDEEEAGGAFGFGIDFEVQLGVGRDGQVYAADSYVGCDGSLLGFWWWNDCGPVSPRFPRSARPRRPISDLLNPSLWLANPASAATQPATDAQARLQGQPNRKAAHAGPCC